MKIVIAVLALLCLVETGMAQNGTIRECQNTCRVDDYHPVCGMEIRVTKREFANPCVMDRENICHGGQYVRCEDWMN